MGGGKGEEESQCEGIERENGVPYVRKWNIEFVERSKMKSSTYHMPSTGSNVGRCKDK